MGQETGVRSDSAAVKPRPREAVEIDRKGSVVRWKNPGYFEMVVVVTPLTVTVVVVTPLTVVVVRETPLPQVAV